MKKKQEEPDLKPLWGLKKDPSVHKSKQKRIFETVNRLIHRIRNDERNIIWSNTSIKLAWECPYHWKKIWPLSVIDITSTSLTLWDVPLFSLLRPCSRSHNRIHGICFFEGILGNTTDITSKKTSISPRVGVFFVSCKRFWERWCCCVVSLRFIDWKWFETLRLWGNWP